MENLTKDQAKLLAESGWWNELSSRDITSFQLFEDRLCMPFDDFHKAVEHALGRSVFNEFGSQGVERLRAEFLGDAEPATLEERLSIIPSDKLIVIGVDT